MSPKKILILSSLIIFLVAANEFSTNKTTKTTDSATATETTTSGEALVGGAFALTDQKGNKFTDENLKGKISLVFFGFTHCPMICPTTLSTLTLAFNQLGEGADKFQIVFITTDPERDDPARIKEYLSTFAAPVIGLTGSAAEVKQAEDAYRVYSEKLPADATGNYDMNHSAIIYVMNAEGKFISHFSSETPVEEVVTKLKALI
jgi:protein SCO1/2